MPPPDAAASERTSAAAPDLALEWLVPLLVCPRCRGPLSFRRDVGPSDGLLAHADGQCAEVYPVIAGIPRLLTAPLRAEFVRSRADWFHATPQRAALAERWRSGPAGRDPVVAGFDYEWSRFGVLSTADAREVFGMYFDLVPPEAFASDPVVLDAGCGAGRWAREVAARGPRVVAVDLGASVELVRQPGVGPGRIACVQADLRDLPLAPDSVEWAYSLGVLHHLQDPDRALGHIARALRPGGLALVYVYYALDTRGRSFRAIFAAVDAIRRVTSRLPRPAALAISAAITVLVYWPLARASALLVRVGRRRLGDALPLSFYRDRSFRTMLNDSLDRFGTALERRYTRDAFEALLTRAGLQEVTISRNAPYWHGVGLRQFSP